MSRGPGRIEKAIEAAFLRQPDSIFTVLDLGAVAFPGLNLPDKKHRVSIIRAADKVADRLWWRKVTSERRGGHVVYSNMLSVRSYALGRMRTDRFHNDESLSQIEAWLEKPEPGCPDAHRYEWHLIQPGGAWWIHVETWKAEQAGDEARAAEMRAILEHQIGPLARRLGYATGSLAE